MAKPRCTFCEQNEGVYMGTNLDDGNCQVACAACLPAFALGMAAAMTAGMPPEVAEAYASAFDSVAANGPRSQRTANGGAARRRGKTYTAETPPGGAEAAPDATSGQGAADDDGLSGSDSAGALTAADVAAIEAADSAGSTAG